MDAHGETFAMRTQDCANVASGPAFGRFYIFGWNGGTQIARRSAVDHSERIQSCILLDPFFELPDMRKIEKAVEFSQALYEHSNGELYAHYWVRQV